MKKIIGALLFVSLFTEMNAASNQMTSLDNSRYEIIISELALRNTFRLDKYNGDVYVMVVTSDNDYRWKLMYKDVATNIKEKENCANYQIVMSGLATKATYLINVHTGTTWILYQDTKTEERFWGLLKGCF